MFDGRIAKKWKCAEIMLFQVSEFLENPTLFQFKSMSLDSYKVDLRESEIIESMINLEDIALQNSCKSGFWKRLKKAAIQIEDSEKINEYENYFKVAFG